LAHDRTRTVSTPGPAGLDRLIPMYDWVQHADGVYSKRYPYLQQQIGAVVCGDGVLLVDTRSHHGQADELAGDLRYITPHPVRWIVNTHHHWDHTFGNARFRPAPIWGHTRCAELLSLFPERMRAEAKSYSPDLADRFDEVEIIPPDHTFDDSVNLAIAGRELVLRHLGRAHTDNDIVVLVPDANVIFAGDLVEESGPPVYQDAYPLEWPDAVSTLLDLVTGPVVPGHGAMVDRDFVAAQQRNLAETATLAVARHAQGMTVTEAAAAGGPFPGDTLQDAFRRAWPSLEMGA
jgi:glyoxylase-like metal-dependent hydrolase (beta-lactamase superfamily II)